MGRPALAHLREPWEGAALPELLTTLKQCLDENAIAAVKVALDGQAYAMEGLT